jgi:hypothetical protein
MQRTSTRSLVARLTLVATVVMLMAALFATAAVAAPKNDTCATIKDGTIADSVGNQISVGFDEFGYNYQAHLFKGPYDGFDRVWGNDTSDLADDLLIMKWSDAWLANVDCDHDGKLDRGLVDGAASGISKGWLTNHVVGDYFDDDGAEHHYTDFVKIVWTGPDSPLWGQYTIIQEVYNDPAAGETGLLDKFAAPGFGLNDHWTTN